MFSQHVPLHPHERRRVRSKVSCVIAYIHRSIISSCAQCHTGPIYRKASFEWYSRMFQMRVQHHPLDILHCPNDVFHHPNTVQWSLERCRTYLESLKLMYNSNSDVGSYHQLNHPISSHIIAMLSHVISMICYVILLIIPHHPDDMPCHCVQWWCPCDYNYIHILAKTSMSLQRHLCHCNDV